MSANAKFNIFKRTFWSFFSNNIENNNIGDVNVKLQSGKKLKVLNSVGTEMATIDEFGRAKIGAAVNSDEAVTKSQMETAIGAFSINDYVIKSPFTGTTTETLIATYFIPANTFSANEGFTVLTRFTRNTGGTSSVIPRLRIGTSSTWNASMPEIANYSISTSNAVATLKRTFQLSGGNLFGYAFSTSLLTDEGASATALSSTPFDPTVDNWIFTSGKLATVTDSLTQQFIKIVK